MMRVTGSHAISTSLRPDSSITLKVVMVGSFAVP